MKYVTAIIFSFYVWEGMCVVCRRNALYYKCISTVCLNCEVDIVISYVLYAHIPAAYWEVFSLTRVQYSTSFWRLLGWKKISHSNESKIDRRIFECWFRNNAHDLWHCNSSFCITHRFNSSYLICKLQDLSTAVSMKLNKDIIAAQMKSLADVVEKNLEMCKLAAK